VSGGGEGDSPQHIAEDPRGEVDEEPGKGPEDSVQIAAHPQLRAGAVRDGGGGEDSPG
jgi:hypothetical protein